jgi:DNA-binding NarL/FixJ family response regulator
MMAKTRAPNLPAVRVAVVDDHPVVREGLASMVANHPDLTICGSAATAAEALDLVRSERPDLAIIDITLKDGSGLDLIKRLKSLAPELKMLVASMHDEALFAERALRAGAQGYISKEEAIGDLVGAIRHVLSGKIYLSPQMTERLLHSAARGAVEPLQDPVKSLSDRELEVFSLIGEGKTTRQIAQRLDLSIKTIETHREHIKKKLRLESGTELIRFAVEWVVQGRRSGA